MYWDAHYSDTSTSSYCSSHSFHIDSRTESQKTAEEEVRYEIKFVHIFRRLSISFCTQYCMPTDSPHLSKQLRPLAVAMSPVLWSRFKPDRFDSFSCGLLLFAMLGFRIPSAQFHERNVQHFLPDSYVSYLSLPRARCMYWQLQCGYGIMALKCGRSCCQSEITVLILRCLAIKYWWHSRTSCMGWAYCLWSFRVTQL